MISYRAPGVPRPNVEEQDLRALTMESAQAEANLNRLLESIVQAQLSHYQAMEPIMLAEQGLQKVTNEDGSFSYQPVNPELWEQGREVERLAQERTLAALRGELPVSPGLERDIEESQRVMQERMHRQLGPGWDTSTPGMWMQNDFTRRSNELREAERRGEIAGANALTIGAQQARANRAGHDPAGAVGANRMGTIGAANLTFGGAGQNFVGYQQPWQADRGLQASANAQAHMANVSTRNALLGGAMNLGGQAIGGLAKAFGFSHPDMKRNIHDLPNGGEQCLGWILSVPVKEWQYKYDDKVRVGGLTTEMPEILVDNGIMLDVTSYLGALTGAIQQLTKELNQIRSMQHEPTMAATATATA